MSQGGTQPATRHKGPAWVPLWGPRACALHGLHPHATHLLLPHLATPQAAAESPWLVLYVAAIATCRTIAEWRAVALAVRHPALHTLCERAHRLAFCHALSGLASVLVTGLVTMWLPLLGQGAAAGVVWLHLLGLPVVTLLAMLLASGRPQQVSMGGAGRAGARRLCRARQAGVHACM
jgi:hypothetical protein